MRKSVGTSIPPLYCNRLVVPVFLGPGDIDLAAKPKAAQSTWEVQ